MKAHELLAQNLRSSRLNKGLSQQALAESIDMAYKYYQELESGRVPTVKLDTIERLANALDVSPWMLLHPDEIEPAKVKRARRSKIDR